MIAGRFSPSIGLVGVDFGTRAVKMLQVREHRQGLRVVGAARADLRCAWADDDPAALAEQLHAAFSSGGFAGRRCVVSLPRRAVSMQAVRLPKMPEDEMRQAALWEASQRFKLERTAMQAEAIPTGAELQGAESREEVLLVAASHEDIRSYLDPLLAAGLRPVAIETHFTALARLFASQVARGEPLAVIDVSRSGSTVLIIRGDQIAFCKPIVLGGDHFDQAVAEHLQMDVDAAHELRAARIGAIGRHDEERQGVGPDPSIDRAVYDAVRPLFSGFAKEVMLCLSYYGVVFRGRPPGRLVLTGGDGLEPRLAETLARQCKIEVVHDEDVSPIAASLGGIREILHRATGPVEWWSVAAGLSLRGMSPARLARVEPRLGQEVA